MGNEEREEPAKNLISDLAEELKIDTHACSIRSQIEQCGCNIIGKFLFLIDAIDIFCS